MTVKRGEIYWVDFDPVRGTRTRWVASGVGCAERHREPRQSYYRGRCHYSHRPSATLSLHCSSRARRKRFDRTWQSIAARLSLSNRAARRDSCDLHRGENALRANQAAGGPRKMAQVNTALKFNLALG